MPDSKHTAQAEGGNARRDALSPQRRSDIARRAALARWGDASNLPRATHDGELEIGESRIACAVLETRKRVLTQESFLQSIGRAPKAKAGTGSHRLVDGLPPFLAAANLKPFISEDLMQSTTPVLFRTVRGTKAFGYDALLLPKVCEVYLQARDQRALAEGQKHIAKACDLLMRGLAQVGIIALVDEATGYQDDRARDELNKILEAYINEELRPWTCRFPNEFFKHIYRLHGWAYQEGKHKRPQYVGRLINELIYEQLPPGVLPELQRRNPPTESGRRRFKHHQLLTEHTGDPHLDRQIIEVVTLLRISENKREFREMFAKAFPKKSQQMVLGLDPN